MVIHFGPRHKGAHALFAMTYRHMTLKKILTPILVHFKAGDDRWAALVPVLLLVLKQLQLTAGKHTLF